MNVKLAISLLKAPQKKPLVTPDITPYMLPDNVTYRIEETPRISGWILVEVFLEGACIKNGCFHGACFPLNTYNLVALSK
jgi:hypothetical protein